MMNRLTSALLALGLALMTYSAVVAADLARRTVVASGIELRILPLGDSITYGYLSSDRNGYRIGLQNDLSGSKLQYIGSVRAGNMVDNYNEGWPGATINEIKGHAISSLPERPNVVLVHAGTNDLNSATPNDPYASAPDRLGQLIDKIIDTCPDAAILVAQIINAANSDTEARIQTFNSKVPGVVAQRANAGHHVMVVDMTSVTTSDLIDGLHPTDAGYNKMAHLWFGGLQTADANGWIKPPVGPDPSTSSTSRQECLSGLFWYPQDNGANIASGVGHGGNAHFTNNWLPQGQIASGLSFLGANGTGVRFADLTGNGRADYLWVNDTSGAVIAYLNTGAGTSFAPNFVPANEGKPIASGVGPGAGVFFADIDGDGKDDYLYVNDNTGAVQVWVNGGPISSGWLWIGPTTVATGVPGGNQKTVIFADINGDGRADYVVKDLNGALNVWLNVGSRGSLDISWTPVEKIAGGLGTSDITLADLDGDGRDDYLMFDSQGGLSGYLNIRGVTEGQPTWVSQGDAKSIAGGVGPNSTFIRMADINGDGKDDYLIVNGTSGAVDLYINNGNADNSVTGDGVRFADIDGDGLDDYIFIDEDGKVTAYVNGGAQSNANLGWIWIPQNDGNPIGTGIGSKRSQIHLADINGDGKADYLSVDPVSGAVIYYRNGGANSAANGGWLWYNEGVIASGIGPGAGVTFADIDGDGRADYIWLSETGAATVYINYVGKIAANWIPLNNGQPIATGVGAYRRDIRFADINGDGRADYIWVHPSDGSVDLWTNEIGVNPANWVKSQGEVATGVGFSGANIQFAKLLNTGRAAYIPITPSNGAIEAWMNGCNNPAPVSGGGGGGSSSGSNPSGSGIVYVDPLIWLGSNPAVQCLPPCILVLPPFPLSSTLTISWPALTTSVLSSTAGTIVTKTTIITIPAIITTKIDFWPVTILSNDPTAATITPEQSIMPPPTTITLLGTEASIQVTEASNPTGTSTTTVVPIFFPTSHSVTIQPQPTVSASVHPPGPPPNGGPSPIAYSNGPPKPTCISGCGQISCDFGCGGHCGIFGCGGACGIFGCGGGCGLLGCKSGGEGGGGVFGGGPPGPGNPPDKPTQTQSGSTSTSSPSSASITYAPAETVLDENWPTKQPNAAYESAIAASMDIYLSSVFSDAGTASIPTFSPSSSPSQPIPPTAPPTVTPTPTVLSPTTAPTTTTSGPPPPPPAPKATCTAVANFANTDVGIWTNYITDSGTALHAAEKICPMVANWRVLDVSTSFKAADGTTWVANKLFRFDIQLTHPAGVSCISRAIIAAGGPKDTPYCPFTPAINPP